MALAEEHFARAKRTEVRDGDELVPATLDESERHPMAGTNQNHAFIANDVRAAEDPSLAFTLRHHQHDRVASELEQVFVWCVVGKSTVAVALTVEIERMRIKRRKVIAGQQYAERVSRGFHVDDDRGAIAKPSGGDVKRQCLRRLDPLRADVAVVGLPVNARPDERRECSRKRFVRSTAGMRAKKRQYSRRRRQLPTATAAAFQAPPETPRHTAGRMPSAYNASTTPT